MAERTITIPEFKRASMVARIRGVTPLIANRFTEEKLRKMQQGQGGEAVLKDEPRDPQREFADASHRFPDGRHGFPAIGVKQAMVKAGQRFSKQAGTVLYGALTVPGDLLAIESPEPPTMRADRVVLNGVGRPTSLVYRPAYWPWEMVVPVDYAATFVTLPQVVNLLTWAGFAVGIGDWRIDHKGTFGQWEVVDVQEIRYGTDAVALG